LSGQLQVKIVHGMLPVLLLLIIETVTSQRTAQLKGNLLFETEHQSTVTINPHYIQFNRQFDLSNILQAINLLVNYTESYAQYCNDIQKDRKRVFDTFQTKGYYTGAPLACQKDHGYLPEVRNEKEAERLMELMKLLEITETPAGLMLKDESLVYTRTGLKNEYLIFKHCKGCNIVPSLLNAKYVFVYAYDEENFLYIKESKCHNTRCDSSTTMLCTKGSEFDSSILTTMATHSCIRDTSNMKQTNHFLKMEYDSFVNVPIEGNRRRRRSAPPGRRKRMIPAIPLIAGGLMGGGLIASAVEGVNPFTFIGEVVGGVFGLATAKDLKMTHTMIRQVSYELSKVQVNQQAIVEAINGMMQHSARLEKLIRYQTHDIAVMYGELDSKIAMRYLQSVIQMTMLKIHASIVSARQFKPSPYVFGQKDLRDLTADRRFFRIKMTTNLDEVATAVVFVESKLTFLIAVPIKEDKTQYHTVKINQLPIFNQGKTYKVSVSNNFYAINTNTNEYIPLTDADYNSCTHRPMCASSAPVFQINSQSPCEILTFNYNSQTCPLEIAPPAGPSFLNYGNTTFYSVPKVLKVNVRCTIDGRSISRHENIDGLGSFQAHTGCTTQVTEQAQIRPIHIAEIHDLASNSIFGVLSQFNLSLVNYPKEPDQNITTPKPLTILEVSSFTEGLNLLLDVKTTSTDVARVFLVLALLLIAFLLLYLCVPSFKLWFNDCCSFTKPQKYWGRMYANVPQFVKIHQPASHLHERLQKFFSTIRKKTTRTSQNKAELDTDPEPIYAQMHMPLQTNTLYPTFNPSNV